MCWWQPNRNTDRTSPLPSMEMCLWEHGLEFVLHGSTWTAGRESKLYVLDMRSAQSFKAEESQKVGQVRRKKIHKLLDLIVTETLQPNHLWCDFHIFVNSVHVEILNHNIQAPVHQIYGSLCLCTVIMCYSVWALCNICVWKQCAHKHTLRVWVDGISPCNLPLCVCVCVDTFCFYMLSMSVCL